MQKNKIIIYWMNAFFIYFIFLKKKKKIDLSLVACYSFDKD